MISPCTEKEAVYASKLSSVNQTSLNQKIYVFISLLATLALLVIGSRFWLIKTYGSSLPYWDQWDGELSTILLPWLDGKLHIIDFFSTHNEHRIVPTKLIIFLLYLFNHQWDSQLEMTVNALLFSILSISLAILLFQQLGSRYQWHIFIGVTLFSVLPFSWENTLMGFQSEFFLLIFFSLGTLWGLSFHTPFSSKWWIGLLFAILGWTNMRSGFLMMVPVLILEGFRLLKQQQITRCYSKRLAQWIICFILLGIGWLLQHKNFAFPHSRVGSAQVLFHSIGRFLSWPSTWPFLYLFNYFPILFLGISYFLFSKKWSLKQNRCAEFLLGLGGWALIQCLATAYARGGELGDLPLLSRYQDLFAFSLLINGLSLFFLNELNPFNLSKYHILSFGTTGWVFVVLMGMSQVTIKNFTTDLPTRAAILRVDERNVKNYLLTGNTDFILSNKEIIDLPYPSPTRLLDLLNIPQTQKILPTSVRRPLAITPTNDLLSHSTFEADGFFTPIGKNPLDKIWGSYTKKLGNKFQGTFQGSIKKEQFHFPYLEFRMSGQLGTPGLTFTLRDEATRKVISFQPHQIAGDQWHNFIIPNPGKSVRIEAQDNSANTWFAFMEPVEMGKLSRWMHWILPQGKWIFLAGLIIFAILLTNQTNAKGIIIPNGDQ